MCGGVGCGAGGGGGKGSGKRVMASDPTSQLRGCNLFFVAPTSIMR